MQITGYRCAEMTARCALAELRNSRDCFKESKQPRALDIFPCEPRQGLPFIAKRDFLLFGLADYAHKELSTLEENI